MDKLTFYLRPPTIISRHSSLTTLMRRKNLSGNMYGVLILMPTWLVAALHLLSLGTTSTKLRHLSFTDFVLIVPSPIRHRILLKRPPVLPVRLVATYRIYIISCGFVLSTPTEETFSAGPFLVREDRLLYYVTSSFHRGLLGW